jgi:hypothetical protein
VDADVYREVTQSTSTPIHTGEQIYLRQNFKSLIDGHAVNVVGPDPCHVGGIAELKWIAEYADLHGMMAPHGTGDGLFGLAVLVQVCATLPQNFIAFEYPIGQPTWWYDIVEVSGGKTSRGVDRRCGGPARTRLAAAHECPGLGAPAPGPRAREPAVTPSTGCPDSSHSCAAASSLACLGQAGVDPGSMVLRQLA